MELQAKEEKEKKKNGSGVRIPVRLEFCDLRGSSVESPPGR